MPLSLPQTPGQDAARMIETPFLTFWRAVNVVLIGRGEQPATGGEIDVYARFNKCDVAAAGAVAWRIFCDRDAPGDTSVRAAQAQIDRKRRDDFLNSERYP